MAVSWSGGIYYRISSDATVAFLAQTACRYRHCINPILSIEGWIECKYVVWCSLNLLQTESSASQKIQRTLFFFLVCFFRFFPLNSSAERMLQHLNYFPIFAAQALFSCAGRRSGRPREWLSAKQFQSRCGSNAFPVLSGGRLYISDGLMADSFSIGLLEQEATEVVSYSDRPMENEPAISLSDIYSQPPERTGKALLPHRL